MLIKKKASMIIYVYESRLIVNIPYMNIYLTKPRKVNDVFPFIEVNKKALCHNLWQDIDFK